MATWKEKAAAIKALERQGVVDPLDLVNAAKDPKHPCHDDFTWDIEQAANERWRDQARAVIRKVHFYVQVDETTERVVNYMPCEDAEETPVFRSVMTIRSKGTAKAILVSELSQLIGNVSRVRGYALAKQGVVGEGPAIGLGEIRDAITAMKSELES